MSDLDPTLPSGPEHEEAPGEAFQYLPETAEEDPWRPRAQGETPTTLARLLGLPRTDGDTNVRLLDRRIEEGLIIEEFSFDSEPGEDVTGILAKPDEMNHPLPAVLCLHGVNQGRKTVMGDRFYYDSRLGWLRGWGRELARQGMLTVSITQRTFGKRSGQLSEQAKIEQLYGRSLMGAFVWEAMQTLDMLASRDDVDENRMGVMGYGLGGTVGFYTAALDDRVKCLVTACGGIGSMDLFARWSDVNFHDPSYFIPGILEHFDHPELVASLAPRAYLLLARDADASMPIEGVRRIEWEGGTRYQDLAVSDRLKITVRPGSHDFNTEEVEEAAVWLSEWLSPEAARAFTVSDPDALALED
ncbi:MAG: alpha/beta hydrolase family protein [Armatimonadetes bacterium]|nr:alpha/beta hydrolase family protein [Armatimonadota bacterium]